MTCLRLALLGGFRAQRGAGETLGLPTRKAQALLAYLALNAGRPCSRETLTGLLWGDRGETQARQSLRQAVASLRRALGGRPCPLSGRDLLQLEPRAVEVDALRFTDLVNRGDPQSLARAAALYAGDLLEGFAVDERAFEEWLDRERRRLRTMAIQAVSTLLAHQLEARASDAAMGSATRLLAFDPFDEAAHRAIMRIHAVQGRRGAALRQYQICAGLLEREFGVEPEEETCELYRVILARGASAEPRPQSVRRPARRRPVRWLVDARPGEPPLVGRDAELAVLWQALDGALAGRGQLGLLLGEAGIGKSRLVDELLAEATRRGARVLMGRCYELEQVLSFRPWAQAFRDAGLGAAPPAGLNPVWQAELVRLLPEWGAPGSSSATEPEDYVRLFEAVTQLVACVTAHQPTVVVLEDLHWADEMTLRLLSYVRRRAAELRLLILGTAREEDVAGHLLLRRFVDDLLVSPPALRVTLRPLTRVDTAALIAALVPGDEHLTASADLVEPIWALSEGNPFVVTEAIRDLRKKRTPAPESAIRLPPRVHEMIAERLDRLDVTERDVVNVAAVVGREFDFPLLVRAAALDAEPAAVAIEALVRYRILHSVGERLDFTHARLREVAYAELVPARRPLLHERVANATEALYGDDLLPHHSALGTHYQEAGSWSRAVHFLTLAGREAHGRSAHRGAVTCLERALTCLSRLPETLENRARGIDVRLALRGPLWSMGEVAKIGDYLRQAEALATSARDDARLGWVLAYLADYYRATGNLRDALLVGHRAQAIAEHRGERALVVATSFYLAAAYGESGQYHRCEALCRRIVSLLPENATHERCGLAVFPAVLAHVYLAQSLAERGAFEDARVEGRAAVEIAEALDHPFSIIMGLWVLAYALALQETVDAAIGLLERGRDTARASELGGMAVLRVDGELGSLYSQKGRADGLALMEQTVARGDVAGLMILRAHRLVQLGRGYLRAGRRDAAGSTALRALELSRQRGERGNEAWALQLLGDIALQDQMLNAEQAEGYYLQSQALAAELGMRPLIARCHVRRAMLCERAGRAGEAQQHRDTATTMFVEMGMNPDHS
jgi:DNA-binding SARP family transcriptional activator/tetratricopeptide (TPR) repeat protein